MDISNCALWITLIAPDPLWFPLSLSNRRTVSAWSPALRNRLCYSMRGLVGCRKRQARPLLSPRFGGAFSWLSCRPPDTETNGSARRFVGGLPPMLEPHRRRFLWCGLRQAASPFLEVSEQKLSAASRRGFFCGRPLCNQASAARLMQRACRALAGGHCRSRRHGDG